MSDLSNQEIKNLLNKLHETLNYDDKPKSLASELESAAKHIPAYIKIIKCHIDQLRSVLELENHNHRTLESAGLALPLQQLIKIFNTLKDGDIQMLEDLAHAAYNWQPEHDNTLQAKSSSAHVYEETT